MKHIQTCMLEMGTEKNKTVGFRPESENKFLFSGTKFIKSKKKNRGFSVNFAYKKYYKKWKELLDEAFPMQEERPSKKRFLKLTYYKHGRKYDQKNFEGGCKPIPDILIRNNWLFDDSTKWIDSDYVMKTAEKGKNEHVMISLYEEEDIDYKSEVEEFFRNGVQLVTTKETFISFLSMLELSDRSEVYKYIKAAKEVLSDH